MAITVRKIDAPVIILSGKVVAGGDATNNAVLRVDYEDIRIDGNDVNNEVPVSFYQGVELNIEPSRPSPVYDLVEEGSGGFDEIGTPKVKQGSKLVDGVNVGDYAETYVTFNGKDPRVDKAHLWRGGTMTLWNNLGGGRTIIKAKTYYLGEASKMSQIELRIVRNLADRNKV